MIVVLVTNAFVWCILGTVSFFVVDLAGALVKYIHNQSLDEEPLILQKLATYLTFHDFPFPNHLAEAMKGMIYVAHYLAIIKPLLEIVCIIYFLFVIIVLYYH